MNRPVGKKFWLETNWSFLLLRKLCVYCKWPHNFTYFLLLCTTLQIWMWFKLSRNLARQSSFTRRTISLGSKILKSLSKWVLTNLRYITLVIWRLPLLMRENTMPKKINNTWPCNFLKYYLQCRSYFRTSLIQIKELLFVVQRIFVVLNHCFITDIFRDIFSNCKTDV